MAYPEIIANWASAGGGSTDVELQPGSYTLEAAPLWIATGPEEGFDGRPEVSVNPLTRSTPRLVPHDPEDGYFDEVVDVLLGDPLDPKSFVVAEAGLYRLGWQGKGTVALVQGRLNGGLHSKLRWDEA